MQLSFLVGLLLATVVYTVPISIPPAADAPGFPKNITMDFLVTALNLTDFNPNLVLVDNRLPPMPKLCSRKHENKIYRYYGPRDLYYRELLCQKYWDVEDAKGPKKSKKRNVVDTGSNATPDGSAEPPTAIMDDAGEPSARSKLPMPEICKHKYDRSSNHLLATDTFPRLFLCRQYWDKEDSHNPGNKTANHDTAETATDIDFGEAQPGIDDTIPDLLALRNRLEMPKLCDHKYDKRWDPKELYDRMLLCKPYWDEED